VHIVKPSSRATRAIRVPSPAADETCQTLCRSEAVTVTRSYYEALLESSSKYRSNQTYCLQSKYDVEIKERHNGVELPLWVIFSLEGDSSTRQQSSSST
jgi:hypothetical protein